MTVRPYPSNTVILHVDDRVLDREMKLALKRSWTYVADAVVRANHVAEGNEAQVEGEAQGAETQVAEGGEAQAAAGTAGAAEAQVAAESQAADAGESQATESDGFSPALESYIEIRVKFGGRPYLSDDEEAEANWSERVAKHIETTLFKVANNNKIFNRYQRNTGASELAFDHIDFVLEDGALTLEYHLDSESDVPREYAQYASEIRTLLCAGTLGDDVRRVRMPAGESWQRQVAHFEEHREEIEAERAAAAEAAELAAEEEEAEEEASAAESFQESPDRAREIEAEEIDVYKQTYEPEPMTEEERKAKYEFPDADFAVDYALWDVVRGDGTSRVFDSSAKAFLDVSAPAGA